MATMTKYDGSNFYVFRDSNNKVITTVGNISSKTNQVFNFSAALKDASGTVVTDGFLLTIKTVDKKTETIYVKASGLTTDGTATKDTFVIRNVKSSGNTVDGSGNPEGDSTTALDDIPEGSIVGIAVHPFHMESIDQAIQGAIATGGQKIVVGDETASAVSIEADQGYSGNAKFVIAADGLSVDFHDKNGSSFTIGAGAGSISGGDGIDVTSSVIAVDLGTDPGLEFVSNKLEAKVKASGGVTKDSDGLSADESNFDYASQAEAEAGTATNKPMNALRTKEAIDANNNKLDASFTSVTKTNGVTTDQTLASYSVPANKLGTANVIKARFNLSVVTFTESTSSMVFKLKYGSTTLASVTIDGSWASSSFGITDDAGFVDIELHANGASAQNGSLLLNLMGNSANTVKFGDIATGAATEDSTGALDLKLDVSYGSTSGSSTTTMTNYAIEILK